MKTSNACGVLAAKLAGRFKWWTTSWTFRNPPQRWEKLLVKTKHNRKPPIRRDTDWRNLARSPTISKPKRFANSMFMAFVQRAFASSLSSWSHVAIKVFRQNSKYEIPPDAP